MIQEPLYVIGKKCNNKLYFYIDTLGKFSSTLTKYVWSTDIKDAFPLNKEDIVLIDSHLKNRPDYNDLNVYQVDIITP